MATVTALPTWDEQIAALPEDALYEEIDGVIVEKPMGAYELSLANILAKLMVPFVEANGLGRVLIEMFFNLRPIVRRSPRPDVAFVSAGRWPLDRRVPRTAAWAVVPDLAVEIVSPTNSASEMERKVDEYFLAGALRVWVVYPDTARVYAYDSPTSVRILTRDVVLVDEAILPGFRLNLAEFLVPPE